MPSPPFEVLDEEDNFSFRKLHEFESQELNKKLTLREKLRIILHSTVVHIIVIMMVFIDITFVLAALLVDFSKTPTDSEAVKHHKETAATALVFASLTVISIFMVEIMLKIYAMGPRTYFRHKLEFFDGIVVVVSFALDIYETTAVAQAKTEPALGLFVILRLWRITRIINGIVLQVKNQEEAKNKKEKERRILAEKEADSLRARVEQLIAVLIEADVPVPHAREDASFFGYPSTTPIAQ